MRSLATIFLGVPSALTRSAIPMASVEQQVVPAQGMTCDAVCFGSIDCGRANPAQEIGALRYSFQVGRVDTMAHTAEVIQLAPCWDVVPRQPPCHSVRELMLALHRDAAIACIHDPATPQPTRIRLRHLGPEARGLLRGILRMHGSQPLLCRAPGCTRTAGAFLRARLYH